MDRYRVTIREVLEREIIVKADCSGEAEDAAERLISDEAIVLDADDFVHREYEAEREIGITREVECLQCDRKFLITFDEVSTDDLGAHTVCPYCKGSFDVDEKLFD